MCFVLRYPLIRSDPSTPGLFKVSINFRPISGFAVRTELAVLDWNPTSNLEGVRCARSMVSIPLLFESN